MGNLVEKTKDVLANRKKAKIITFGVDQVGKTSLINRLKLGKFTETIPSIEFTVESFTLKKINLVIWDLGGHRSPKALWRHYFDNTNAIIFVIDVSDKHRLDSAKILFDEVMGKDDLRDIPLLVFGNKNDIGTINADEIIEKLELAKIDRKWKVQMCSAYLGDGVFEGLDWIYANFNTK